MSRTKSKTFRVSSYVLVRRERETKAQGAHGHLVSNGNLTLEDKYLSDDPPPPELKVQLPGITTFSSSGIFFSTLQVNLLLLTQRTCI